MRVTPTHRPIRRTLRDATAVNPGDYIAIVGQSFVKHERAPLLVIGKHQWDRWTLGRLGCPHPKAAAALNRVVQSLRITTLAALAEHAREIGGFKGMGVTAYWTVLAILREHGYDVVDVHHDDHTFSTLKRRAVQRHRQRQPRLRRRSSTTASEARAEAADTTPGA